MFKAHWTFVPSQQFPNLVLALLNDDGIKLAESFET
jgi:hypothetical protein